MKPPFFLPSAHCKCHQYQYLASSWSIKTNTGSNAASLLSSLRRNPPNRYIAYTCIIMVAVFIQLRTFFNVHQVTIQQDMNDPPRTTTTLSTSNGSMPTPITTGNITMDSKNRSESDMSWPPMDMINHIWDHLSTNSNDKAKRRLVVVASNQQYTDFAMNFAYSLIKQNVYNFVIVPLDDLAYTILHDTFPDHTLPIVQEFVTIYNYNATTDAASYGSREFKVVTSTRPTFIKPFLQNNITIFYNDIDMVWQNNAWDVIDQLTDKTNIVTNDNYKNLSSPITVANQNYDVLLWYDGPKQICTCMFYMVPSNASRIMVDEWNREIKKRRHKEDQRAFNKIYDNMISSNSSTVRDAFRVLINDEQFPTGRMYWWKPQKNTKAVVIHNNWIIGKYKKAKRFKEANLWFVP